MKTLLAIFTCHQLNYSHPEYKDWFVRSTKGGRVAGIRDSWLRDVTCDHKFFYGRTATRSPENDEIFLPCADDYYHSADKIQAIIRYALYNGYDNLLKIDDDVYAYWGRLMQNVPEADYVGGGRGPFVAGPSYWLSHRALRTLASGRANSWAEDAWVGMVLANENINPVLDSRYYIAPFTRTNQYITDEELSQPHDHLTIHSLTPEQMRREHANRIEHVDC
jgi:hypothetical protein